MVLAFSFVENVIRAILIRATEPETASKLNVADDTLDCLQLLGRIQHRKASTALNGILASFFVGEAAIGQIEWINLQPIVDAVPVAIRICEIGVPDEFVGIQQTVAIAVGFRGGLQAVGAEDARSGSRLLKGGDKPTLRLRIIGQTLTRSDITADNRWHQRRSDNRSAGVEGIMRNVRNWNDPASRDIGRSPGVAPDDRLHG